MGQKPTSLLKNGTYYSSIITPVLKVASDWPDGFVFWGSVGFEKYKLNNTPD
jgi:hypothetical protein